MKFTEAESRKVIFRGGGGGERQGEVGKGYRHLVRRGIIYEDLINTMVIMVDNAVLRI